MPLPPISPATKTQILAEALPYIRSFHGKTFVIKYGGNAMTESALKVAFASDVALLRLVGMSPIVVHDCGPQFTALLDRMGVQSTFRQGMQVIDDKTMNLVEMVLGELNQEIVGLISQHGGKAVGLSGQDGKFIRARKKLFSFAGDGKESIDLGFVGDVAFIDPEIIDLLRSRDFIPVVMPIGVGSEGEAYKIDADVVAGKLAEILKAEKLILMTDSPGVLDGQGELITGLTASEIEGLFSSGTIDAEMLPSLKPALAAVKNGVKAAHIIDGRVSNALLLEVLTSEGVGTTIRSNEGPHFFVDSQRYFTES
jgi:acetylglutamate kinase